MTEEERVAQAVNNIYDDKLAIKIKQNIKNASLGIAFGAFAGFIIAAFTGKCKICLSIAGAAVGGTVGYIATPKEPKNLNCCL